MSTDVQNPAELRAAVATGSSMEQARSSGRDPASLTGDRDPDHIPIDRSSAKRTIVAVVLLAGVLPALVGLSAYFLVGATPHVQDTLHECLELVGSCVAIFVALLLLLRLRHAKASPHLLWVVAALLAMGLVDAVHAVHGITASSWLRHGATLLGGTLFGLVWLPLSPAVTRRKGLFVFVVAALVLAVAAGLWFRSEWLPMLWDPAGFYTLPVKAANGLGGLGFLAAALFFLRRYLNQPEVEDLAFGSLTLLFGTAALFFGFSHTWAADWWIWHGFRLLAYVIVLVAAYEMIGKLYEQSARDAQELERRAASLYARSLFEASLDPLVAISLTGKITDVNAATEEATGRDRHELVGSDFTDCFTEPEKARESYQEVLANGLARDYPLTIRHTSGRTTDVLYNASLFRDEAGAVQGVFAAARDVTERKRTEEALSQSRERLLLSQQAGGIGHFSWDIQNNINEWSDEIMGLYGLQPGGFGGKYESWREQIFPDDVEAADAAIQKSLVTGDFAHDFRVVWPDKSLHWLHSRARVFFSEDGKPLRMVGVSMDVTDRKRAGEALARSEAILQQTQEVSGVGGWEYNVRTQQLTWTDEVYRIHEVPRDYNPNTVEDAIEFYAIEDRRRVTEAFGHAITQGEPYDLELQLVTAKDRPRWVRAVGRAEIQDGKVVRVYGSIVDITERKHAEDAIARLAAIVESSSDAIISKGLDGMIVSWNRGAERIYGYTAAEAVGRSVSILAPPEGVDEIEGILTRIHSGECVDSYETLRVAKGGKRIPVSLSVSPVHDASGKIVGASTIAQDITERKRAEDALHDSEERFRTMVDAIPQLAWMAQPDGFIFWYNQRWYEFTGTTPKQMEGWGWQSVHDPEMLPKVLERWKASIATGQPFEMHFPLRGSDGGFHWFLTRVFPVKDASGNIVRWFGTSTDVNQMREVEEQVRLLNASLEERVAQRTADLETANKELEAFSYSVSHDLRAPLRGVDSFSRILVEDYSQNLDDEGKRLLNIVRGEAQRMGRLIDDLLSFSRMGRQEMQLAECDMATLARSVFESMNVTNRAIHLDLKPPPRAFGDRAMLRQVLFNLLSNAVKFTRHQSEPAIEFGGATADGSTTYYVKDNGVGFDPRFAHKLFKVFQRLHTEEEFEGTGVGLALVQRIVQRHGGEVWAEGNLNQGATFYFSLPTRKEV